MRTKFLILIATSFLTVLLGLVYVDFSDYFVIASKDVVGRIYVKKINVSLGREYYVSISESRWKKYSEKKDFLFTQYDPKVFLKLSQIGRAHV